MKAYHAGFFASFILSPVLVFASSVRAVSESKYTKAHSLGNNYSFDPRDGWQSINATNLQYKYRRQEPDLDLTVDLRGDSSDLESRTKKNNVHQAPHKAPHKTGGLGQVITGVVADIWKGLKGFGKPEPVTITWYTGHDLEKPSCWANSVWAPTDESFTCALTMEGWMNRPKCFKFLELCHTPKKCVFVRVVDTCAGCAPGSKHVDLTRAAFGQLAKYDVGILTVQLRPATEPEGW
ncbi:hypothetical protein BYT27DRAFT_7273979 [Phlegmacium glaucopus]|nr:hypothetical protein BYT27DRAFT_7273979 [Phlegmacium glaucopus]